MSEVICSYWKLRGLRPLEECLERSEKTDISSRIMDYCQLTSRAKAR